MAKNVRDRMEKHFTRRNQMKLYILIFIDAKRVEWLYLCARTKGWYEWILWTCNNNSGKCGGDIQALMDWFKRYGVVFLWVSDQGSHFKNAVIGKLRKILGAQHHFVMAHCPWANGTVEVMNRQSLKVMRSLLSEKQQRTVNWASLLPLCKSTLNQIPSSRLGGIAPVTYFTALPQKNPISVLY